MNGPRPAINEWYKSRLSQWCGCMSHPLAAASALFSLTPPASGEVLRGITVPCRAALPSEKVQRGNFVKITFGFDASCVLVFVLLILLTVGTVGSQV